MRNFTMRNIDATQTSILFSIRHTVVHFSRRSAVVSEVSRSLREIQRRAPGR